LSGRGKGFALAFWAKSPAMAQDHGNRTPLEVFTADEVARAAGAPASRVLQYVASGAIGVIASPMRARRTNAAGAFFAFDDAVDAVRALRTSLPFPPQTADGDARRLFFTAPVSAPRSAGWPIAVSGTVHAGIVACVVLITSFGLTPEAATRTDRRQRDAASVVFVAWPGPGGGGGGGGLRQPTPAPRAARKGLRAISSPMPARRNPEPIVAADHPSEPPLLKSEPLPPIIAPIAIVPGNQRDRFGTLDGPGANADSRGPGEGGGVGNGNGTGLGEGSGPGVGPGSGGGIGGGPYRPGAGITPPQLLREIKADYTEDARRQGTTGDVVLEIVVRRDGTVGDIRLTQGLPFGLNDCAIQAVRQWRFEPARRLGQPVDVMVEVAVEFRLR
jgi:periplasmic protein TonB